MTSARGVKVFPAREGRILKVLGETLTFKVVSEDTGGSYALIEIETPPGLGPPLHVHRREDEGFFVLQGGYEIRVGDQTITAPPGAFAFLPRNIPHAYKNVGAIAARLLAVITPGGFEKFLAELSLLPPGPPDLAKVAAIGREYALEFV
jgi:quercetin dioxygenase-like cupin family protein